jgi:hypothetical protein
MSRMNERNEKFKTQLFTPSRRLKPVFSTGFLEKSRNFSKRGMGFARSLFSKVLKTPDKTLSFYFYKSTDRQTGSEKKTGFVSQKPLAVVNY